MYLVIKVLSIIAYLTADLLGLFRSVISFLVHGYISRLKDLMSFS